MVVDYRELSAILLLDEGKAYSFGDGANGQLGHGTMVLSCGNPKQITTVTEKFIGVSCGESHTALVTRECMSSVVHYHVTFDICLTLRIFIIMW